MKNKIFILFASLLMATVISCTSDFNEMKFGIFYSFDYEKDLIHGMAVKSSNDTLLLSGFNTASLS